MPLINTSVSNLVQGVSQQPDAVRFTGQCEEQENALPSIVDGLQKRPGSQCIATLISGAELDANAKVHFIERDKGERYVVIIKTNADSTKSIAAYNLATGNQATITERYIGVVESYVDYDVGGYHVATLTQKPPVTVQSNETARLGKLRIIDGLNEGATLYDVHDIATDPAQKTIRFSGSGVTLYGNATGSYQNTIEYTVNNTAGAELILETRNYLTHGIDDSTPTVPVDDLKLFTTGDVTYVLNTKKTVAKDTTVSAPLSNSALVFVKQGDYDRKYGLRVEKSDGTVYENWTYSGAAQKKAGSVYHNTAKEAESDYILRNLFEGTTSTTGSYTWPRFVTDADGISHSRWDKPLNLVSLIYMTNQLSPSGAHYNAAQAADNATYLDHPSLESDAAFSVELKGGQIGVINGPADFLISIDDSTAGEGLGLAHKSIANITDLPNIATHGFKIAVQGDVDEAADDRYVRFFVNGHTPDTADGSLGDGSWYETSGGNLNDRIDTLTMPMLLKSTAVDAFELNHMPLNKLAAGDADTNPDPSFIGNSIEKVFQFKSRLGFLSGSSVSMSEVKFGGYNIEADVQSYNFYRTSVTSLLDGDPIDATISSSKVTKLRAAVAFQDNLILFSDFCQFVLKGGDLLSPKTVSFNQITEYDYARTVDPIALGSYIYFPFSRGNFMGIREFTVNASTDNFDANEITAHVPQYIAKSATGGLVALAGTSAESLMATTDGTDIYIYKYMFSGNDKALSSWGKFTVSGGGIRGLTFIDSELYVVQSISDSDVSQTHLLKIPVGNKHRDPEGYNTHLDRRVEVTLDATAATPSFNLPYSLRDDEEVEIYTKDGLLLQNTQTSANGAQTLVTFHNNIVSGGLTGAAEKLYAGLKYTMKYTFSQLIFKAQAGQNMTRTAGKMRVRGGTIFFEDTSHFEVKVTPHLRDTSTSQFNATIIQATQEGGLALESGSFQFPVFTSPEQTTITIENSSAMPCNMQSAEFESFVHQRSRRYA
jgi:hypothetical protein